MKPEKKISNTCIAIVKNRKGKLMIAGDRRCSWGDSFAQSMEFPKISKKDNILLGATGSGDMCSLFVEEGGFQFPEKRTRCLNTYMYHTVKLAVHRFLLGQKYGKNDELMLPPGTYVEIVIGIEGQVWSLVVQNPLKEDTAHFAGSIDLGRIPSIPYVTGCGRSVAYGILMYELRKTGYITKDILKDTFEITGQVSPGCDSICDIIIED